MGKTVKIAFSDNPCPRVASGSPFKKNDDRHAVGRHLYCPGQDTLGNDTLLHPLSKE